MQKNSKIHIGTSGWHYEHWKGPFYPKDLSQKEFLDYYKRYFDTVEINNTFYQLPSLKTFELWNNSVSNDFLFSIKASRYITHMKKLKDPKEALNRFFEHIQPLVGKIGVILFQLPPRWHKNPERLETFLETLPSNYRYSFELRDTTWFDEEIYQILESFNAAFCIYDFNGIQSPKKLTADFVYVRLHGPDGPYAGRYDSQTLQRWAKDILDWNSQGKEIFCYFDNDENGYAALNALELKDIIFSSK